MSNPTPAPLRSENQISRTNGEPDVLPTDTSPEVAHGAGEPAAAHLVEDPYIGVRAEHLEPVPRPLGAQEASRPSEYGPMDAADQKQDAMDIPPEPSIWEAREDGEEG